MNLPMHRCSPQEISLKSFFLGPQSENAPWVSEVIVEIFERWFQWRREIAPQDGCAISIVDQATPEFLQRKGLFSEQLDQLLTRLEQEVPKFSPRYAGHMFSEICLPGLFGHIAALIHNPNNISRESAQVGVDIESEAIAALAVMVGMPIQSRGHFTSGGTVANIEALIRARSRAAKWIALAASKSSSLDASGKFYGAHCGWQKFGAFIEKADPLEEWVISGVRPVILAPASCHYSWQKAVHVVGLSKESLWHVDVDSCGRMNMQSLRARIDEAMQTFRPILMVVSVAGTTELGQFDQIDEIQAELDERASLQGVYIWHHIDAAYGGFFRSIAPDDPTIHNTALGLALNSIGKANSITLDPHKLGYVPYACGVALVADPQEYTPMSFEVPYVQFAGADPGPFTLEGSRAATGAAATWMIARTVGLDGEGYGRILARTIHARMNLEQELLGSSLPFRIAPGCTTNVLCFTIAFASEALTVSNDRMKYIYASLSPGAAGPFVVAKTTIREQDKTEYFRDFIASWDAEPNCGQLELIRMCLLNPFLESREMKLDFTAEFVSYLTKICHEYRVEI